MAVVGANFRWAVGILPAAWKAEREPIVVMPSKYRYWCAVVSPRPSLRQWGDNIPGTWGNTMIISRSDRYGAASVSPASSGKRSYVQQNCHAFPMAAKRRCDAEGDGWEKWLRSKRHTSRKRIWRLHERSELLRCWKSCWQCESKTRDIWMRLGIMIYW